MDQDNIINFNQEKSQAEYGEDLKGKVSQEREFQQTPLEPIGELDSKKQQAFMAVMSCNVQVNNLIAILFTIDFDVLKSMVQDAPGEVKETNHWRVLNNALAFYKSLGGGNQLAGQDKEDVRS